MADGTYLGSQDDLVSMLGVGRVTLHQAVRLLEREGLIVVRRGHNGGYFARGLDETGIEESIIFYLLAKKFNFREAFPIHAALNLEMARLAARSKDEAAREELRQVGNRIEKLSNDISDPEIVELDFAYIDAVFKLAANPLGKLMVHVTRRLISETGPQPLVRDRRLWKQDRLNIIRAILDNDDDYVQIVFRKFNRRIQRRLASS